MALQLQMNSNKKALIVTTCVDTMLKAFNLTSYLHKQPIRSTNTSYLLAKHHFQDVLIIIYWPKNIKSISGIHMNMYIINKKNDKQEDIFSKKLKIVFL